MQRTISSSESSVSKHQHVVLITYLWTHMFLTKQIKKHARHNTSYPHQNFCAIANLWCKTMVMKLRENLKWFDLASFHLKSKRLLSNCVQTEQLWIQYGKNVSDLNYFSNKYSSDLEYGCLWIQHRKFHAHIKLYKDKIKIRRCVLIIW